MSASLISILKTVAVAGGEALRSSSRLLLCSDGLYAALEESEVAPLFSRDAQQTAEALVAFVLAQERRGQDNLTVAILACA